MFPAISKHDQLSFRPSKTNNFLSYRNDNAQSILSGRNFDTESRAPKLGFSNPPTMEISDETGVVETVELASNKLEQQALEALKTKSGKQINLETLQPKRANWDLKRDLEPKLQILEDRTQNAIIQKVRERLQKERQAQPAKD